MSSVADMTDELELRRLRRRRLSQAKARSHSKCRSLIRRELRQRGKIGLGQHLAREEGRRSGTSSVDALVRLSSVLQPMAEKTALRQPLRAPRPPCSSRPTASSLRRCCPTPAARRRRSPARRFPRADLDCDLALPGSSGCALSAPELKLVVMSATLDRRPCPLSSRRGAPGGSGPPVPGRVRNFPMPARADPARRRDGRAPAYRGRTRRLRLVFMPGLREIRRRSRSGSFVPRARARALRPHGSMDPGSRIASSPPRTRSASSSPRTWPRPA